MFSYKGIDNDYKYKRGIVDAKTEIEAINSIKNEENILIIVSLKKVVNIKIINNIRKGMGKQVVNLENQINSYAKKVSQKREDNKERKKEKKLTEGTELAQKSPVLKILNNLIDRLPNRRPKFVIDEEMYNNLQFMFKEQDKRGNILNSSTADIEFSEELANNKISNVKTTSKIDKAAEKSINWSLLDSGEDNDPLIKKNKKIKVKEKEIIMFTRRLHIMISSGVSLLSALSLLRESSSKNMEIVLSGVLEDISKGSTFSAALAKYPSQFNYAYISLIAIGETSGSLDKSLSDLIKMKEQEQKIIRKVRTASIYPAIVGVVLVIMMVAAAVFFLPRFEEMYEEQELPIPAFTQIVFGLASKIPYIVAGIVLLFGILTIARKKIPEVNYLYRRYVDKLILKMPIVKDIMNSMYMHSFSSTISLMLDNGIRLSDTLALTGRTINNIYIKNEIEDVGQLMRHGLTFSEALGEQPHFDDILVNIALTGEESGRMVFSLSQVADYFEIEMNKRVDAMMEVIPPLSIALIAVIAAPVIIAAYLPILEISSGAGLGL